jgi:hemolysin III
MSASEPSIYPPREERWHVITHAAGLLLAVAGLAGLLWISWQRQDGWRLAASLVYGLSLCFSFASSALYHAARNPARRRLLRHLDHVAIYLLIAGTYTPFLLVSLRGVWGWSLLPVIWLLAVAGIGHEFHGRRRRQSLFLYLGMGWIVGIAIQPMLEHVPLSALWLLLAGGILYSAGVAFYVRKGMPWHHVVWHLFVLAAAILQYASVWIVIAGPTP